MTCYKDKTFCPFSILCKNCYTCDRIPTDKDREEAKRLNLPFCYYKDFPECFVRWFE